MSVFCFAITIAPIGCLPRRTGSATARYVRLAPGGVNSNISVSPDVQSTVSRPQSFSPDFTPGKSSPQPQM